MTNLNNNYKRFQSYENANNVNNNIKKDYVEMNYNSNNKLSKPTEIGNKKELPKQDNSFLRSSVRLTVNSNGQFDRRVK